MYCAPPELDTKTVVESGTRDVVFRLDSGGEVILQMQFLLSDADRRRIQEMVSWLLSGFLCEIPEANLFMVRIEKETARAAWGWL
jgi:hypothetical protein